jgi:hypothetical protein
LKAFSPGARGRLTDYDLDRFPGDTLFHKIARAVCHAGCLPRHELYESWEVARRTRRLFRGGRLVDMAAGHGLLAHMMLLLDDSSPLALAVDPRLPASAEKVHDAILAVWPRLAGRVTLASVRVDDIELDANDVVVSSHGCGSLTDVILDRAAAARAKVAVLPCCHDLDSADAKKFASWMDGSLAIDVERAHRLERRGYRVWTQTIADGITAKARLLLASPAS